MAETDTRCPAGQAYFPGGASCEAVGPPCPAGDLPEGLPADRVVLFVSTNAVAVGPSGRRLGHRIDVLLGATLTLERGCIRDNYDIGIYLSDGPVSLRDVEVSGTKFESDTGWYGRGVILRGMAAVTGERLLVRGNHMDCAGRSAAVGLSVLAGLVVTAVPAEVGL